MGLKERFPNSEELFTEPPPTPEAPPPSAERVFLQGHPEVVQLCVEAPTSDKRKAIVETISNARVSFFKEQAGKREHSFTPEEIDWAAEVLRLRIQGAVSAHELQKGLQSDMASDFDKLSTDLNERSRRILANADLSKRYGTTMAADLNISPERYLSRPS